MHIVVSQTDGMHYRPPAARRQSRAADIRTWTVSIVPGVEYRNVFSACRDAGDTCAGRATEAVRMADTARIPLAVGFLVVAVSVMLLFQTISLVAVGFVAAGAGLAWLALRYSADLSAATNAAQLGLGLGFLFEDRRCIRSWSPSSRPWTCR